jgi:hypothetical protein
MRLDVEVAVSDVGDRSTMAGLQYKPGWGIEGDTVFPEMLKDQASELQARHWVRGIETGVPVERDDAALRHGWAGSGDQRNRLRNRSNWRRGGVLGRLRGGADGGEEAEANDEGGGANRRGWSIDHCCSVLVAMCRFVFRDIGCRVAVSEVGEIVFGSMASWGLEGSRDYEFARMRR